MSNIEHGFNYDEPIEKTKSEFTLESIKKINSHLDENSYVTHMIMADYNKDLTEEQKKFHMDKAISILSGKKYGDAWDARVEQDRIQKILNDSKNLISSSSNINNVDSEEDRYE